MSLDHRDDNYITPDWDDLDLSWLDYLETSYTPEVQPPSPPRPGREPMQTRIEPTRSGRDPMPARRDGQPAHREPAPARRDSQPAHREPAPARRDSQLPRREPASVRRDSQFPRREPAPIRRDGQPVQSRRDPAQLRREPTQTRRTPARREPLPDDLWAPMPQNRRDYAPQNRQPASPRPGGQARPGGKPPRREVQPPKPAYRPRRRRRTSVPLIILIVLLVGGMAFAGWRLGSIFLNYRRDRSAYNDLAAHAISEFMVPEGEAAPEDPDDPEQQVHSVSEVPISVDWEYLRSINPNTVGWLYCPGTVVSYPVVQSSDHEFYLTHGFDGQPNVSGTLFADRNSVSGITQSNYIIYGHNMKDNSMFGTFANYVDKSYYDSNPVLYYLTPDTNYRIELVCAHIAEATIENFPTYFGSTAEYQSYLSRISASAFWVNYDMLNSNHQLITMSTCTYTSGYTDPRFLLHGVMIPLE